MTAARDLPGLDLPSSALQRLEALEALVRRWTIRINLISPSTVPDLWTRHIADSAQLWELAQGDTWADLGSGGGFPGLVIAALAADTGTSRVVLIESDQRKATFLRTAVRELALPAAVLDQRAEAAPPQAAAVVSARALARLPTLLPLVARHLAPGGVALLPKGRGWEAEVDAARAAGWRFALDALPSRTDPSGRVLRVADIAHG
jgi:16S rRNA (guanine527-N7)-methyltransferase